jgi:hydrogenase/urease accessory protein HupE
MYASLAVLPASGSFEVVATHTRPDARRPLALRSTFHVLTDDSHRVIARVERDGVSEPMVLTAETPEHALPDAPRPSWLHALAPPGSFGALLLLGVEHILTGYDHLVFLLCLLVPGGTWRSRVAIVTAFTLAHSVTLVLAALQIVTLPARFVEAAIAVSIAYVAIENLLHDQPRTRWPAAFGFGLVHGFGFAGMLHVLDLPVGALVSSVVAFNLGVEVGQLAVVAVAVPLVALASRHAWHRRLVQSASVGVCALAAYWIVERLQ